VAFTLPPYREPDFRQPSLAAAPAACTVPAPAEGVAPEQFHATSNHPEYVHRGGGRWLLAPESRMDCVLVLSGERLAVVEPRRLTAGEAVVVGRTENGEDGIFVHTEGFTEPAAEAAEKFAFGNMVPSYRIMPEGQVRPVYFYIVDMSEFSTDKLANRGSAQAAAILTNVQDFLVNLWRSLAPR